MIWLVGNKGMLGTELSMLLAKKNIPSVGTDREVDILDPAALQAFTDGKGITWVVNCAAYTAVDKAEDEEAFALRLNAEGPENIARLCVSMGARLLHVSTDYVFDGNGTRPYLEADAVSPAGAYGRTKAEGEKRVMAVAPGSVILRTAWLYGKHGPNFVYTMLRLMKSKEEIGVVSDQQGSPTWAYDLSCAIADIVSRDEFPAGIYHFTNAGQTNWYDFALEIHRQARELGLLDRDCRIKALTTAEYPTKTKRPAYSVLSKEKIIATGVAVPEWKMALGRFFEDCFKYLDDMTDLTVMAEYDLDTAGALLESGRYLYVAYACQQALEKNLKVVALLAHSVKRINDLGLLAKQSNLFFSSGEHGIMHVLTDYYIKGRYPKDIQGLMVAMDRTRTTFLFDQTRQICAKIRKHPVFSIL